MFIIFVSTHVLTLFMDPPSLNTKKNFKDLSSVSFLPRSRRVAVATADKAKSFPSPASALLSSLLPNFAVASEDDCATDDWSVEGKYFYVPQGHGGVFGGKLKSTSAANNLSTRGVKCSV
jgi:hypothetical protein